MRLLPVLVIVLLAGCCNDIHSQISNYLKPMNYTYMNPPNNIDSPGTLFNSRKERQAAASELGLTNATIDGATALPQYTGNDSYTFEIGSLGAVIPQLPSPASINAALSLERASKMSIKFTNPKVKVLTEFGYRKAFVNLVAKTDVEMLRGIFPDNRVVYVSEVVEVDGMECSFYTEANRKIAIGANATLGTVHLSPEISAKYKGDDQYLLNFSKPLYIGYKTAESQLPSIRTDRVQFAPSAPKSYAYAGGSASAAEKAEDAERKYREAEAAFTASVARLAQQQKVANASVALDQDLHAVIRGGAVTVEKTAGGAPTAQQAKKQSNIQNKVLTLPETGPLLVTSFRRDVALREQQAAREEPKAQAAAAPKAVADEPHISFSRDKSAARVFKGDRIITVHFTEEKGRPQ